MSSAAGPPGRASAEVERDFAASEAAEPLGI
jgi:hypothetical protein